MADTRIAEIATGIRTILDGVAGIGVTFDHQPLPVNDWAAYVRSFTVEAGTPARREVRAWTVAWTGFRGSYRAVAVGSQKVLREATFLVRGHMSMRDDTEPVFRALVATVADALDADPSLAGSVIEHDACDVLLPDEGAGIFLGDVLCHYGVITVVARYEVTL